MDEQLTLANGAKVIEDKAHQDAYLDPKTRRFHCSNGHVWKLSHKTVDPLFIAHLMQRNKPEVPKQVVVLLGKHQQLQENPKDPDYLKALENWQAQTNQVVMRYIFVTGLEVGDIPDAFVEERLEYLPNASSSELAYAYVLSKTPPDDFDQIMEAILGEHDVTQGGLEQAAASFPGEG